MSLSPQIRVYLVRHAEALDRAIASRDGVQDRDRPLTPKGIQQAKRLRKKISKWAPDVILVSNYRRALETCKIACVQTDHPNLKVWQTGLHPEDSPSKILQWLTSTKLQTVVVFGHEPHLSKLVAKLLGTPPGSIRLRKGHFTKLVRMGTLWKLIL